MSEEVKQSALEENISRKGVNSYYYAHGKKIEGPQWDGKEEPRLLSTEPVEISVKNLSTPLDSYSWLDEEKSVKLYIDFSNASDVEDNNIVLDVQSDNLEFRVSHDGKQYALNIAPLHSNVASASYKKKTDKFLIILKKETEASWYSLKKSS